MQATANNIKNVHNIAQLTDVAALPSLYLKNNKGIEKEED